MNPKKRLRQKQTHRLFFRDNDHRDVVYNNNYINIIMFNGNASQNLVSAEYAYRTTKTLYYNFTRLPSKCLITSIYSRSNDIVNIGYYDIDRDTFHMFDWNASIGNKCFRKLKDYIITETAWSSSSYAITKDGAIWSYVQIPTGGIGNLYNWTTYGPNENMIAEVWYPSSDYDNRVSIGVYEFYEQGDNKDGRGKVQMRYSTATHNLGVKQGELRFVEKMWIQNRQGGVLMCYVPVDMNYVVLYRVTLSSAERMGIISPPSSAFQAYAIVDSYSSMVARYNEDGSDTLVICSDHSVRNGNEYHKYLVAYASNDGGHNWTSTRLINNFYYGAYPNAWENKVCVRKGIFYLYASQYGIRNLHVFKSSNGVNWTELSMPSYIEIKVKKDGQCVNNNPSYDKVRIKMRTDSPNSSDARTQNVDCWDAFLSATSQGRDYFYGPANKLGNLMMENGKVVENDSWVSFRMYDTYFYFDNPELTPNDNCFVIYGVPMSESLGNEIVMAEDYCVKGE